MFMLRRNARGSESIDGDGECRSTQLTDVADHDALGDIDELSRPEDVVFLPQPALSWLPVHSFANLFDARLARKATHCTRPVLIQRRTHLGVLEIVGVDGYVAASHHVRKTAQLLRVWRKVQPLACCKVGVEAFEVDGCDCVSYLLPIRLDASVILSSGKPLT